ncbi:MAG TPA: DUF4129 domain-containing protein [Acidimicrobiales bacterium]|nr:DUF4129 domain-containing protein [Acidimicrobiales bacterium]
MFVRPGSDLPVGHHDPAGIHAATRDILGRAEFRPPRRSWWAAALGWIGREIARLFGDLTGAGGGAGGWVAVAVLVVIVVVVAVISIRLWVRMPARGSPPFVVTAAVAGRSAVDWRAEAARHDREGRWRDALRCRYRALVADLAGRGVVEEIPGRTAGEYRGEVAVRAPGVSPLFRDATERFEGAWYGGVPSGPDDQVWFDEVAGRVLSGVPAGPR